MDEFNPTAGQIISTKMLQKPQTAFHEGEVEFREVLAELTKT